MITKKTLLLVTFCFLVPTAGCAGTIPGEGVSIIFSGDVKASESGFQMEGQVSVGSGVSENKTLDSIAVELYTANGDLIYREPIGQMDAPYGKVNVSITSVEQPEYIIFTSPDFWEDPVEDVEYYKRYNETHYEVGYATNKDDLPQAVREGNKS